MNAMIWIDTTVGAAEEFVRQMALRGYEAADVADAPTRFEFSLGGRVEPGYEVVIDYARGTARVGVTPYGK